MHFCKEDCDFISPPENGRETFPTNKNMHTCVKYNDVLHHRTFYPKLVRLPKCVEEDTN
jgi:hypothetical protein